MDRQLISLMRANARATVAHLAKSLRVSRGTVQNRIRKLEADGTIVGYTVRLRPQAERHHIRALMTVAVEGNRSEAVLRAFTGDPAVEADRGDAGKTRKRFQRGVGDVGHLPSDRRQPAPDKTAQAANARVGAGAGVEMENDPRVPPRRTCALAQLAIELRGVTSVGRVASASWHRYERGEDRPED